MTSNQYDAIIIGGGHNGLVAAAYLARAGKKVVVLERRHIVGAAVTEEIFPDYKFTEFSYVVSLLCPEIIRDLELPKCGLKTLPLPSTVTPMENGDYLAVWDDHDLTRREIYRHSPKDAEAYDEHAHVMARATKKYFEGALRVVGHGISHWGDFSQLYNCHPRMGSRIRESEIRSFVMKICGWFRDNRKDEVTTTFPVQELKAAGRFGWYPTSVFHQF